MTNKVGPNFTKLSDNGGTSAMTLYRLGTQWDDTLHTVVANYFDGFAIVKGIGYWKGQQEESATIEVMSNEPDAKIKVQQLAKAIRDIYRQDAVLVMALDLLDWRLV